MNALFLTAPFSRRPY